MRIDDPGKPAERDRQSGGGVYVYGQPPLDLAEIPSGAEQVSPLAPGAGALENIVEASAGGITVAAPSGTIERRYVLALSLRALRSGGELVVLAPKDKGGSRIHAELSAFGCEVEDSARRHHRICRTLKPATPLGIREAIKAGQPRRSTETGRWTQPGIFSWDRLDPGTALLARSLPSLAGPGADLGGGAGDLAEAVLASPAVTQLAVFDIDRRAIEAARRNLDDPRVRLHWADVRLSSGPADLDFVVMNPPFHEGAARIEDRSLGQAFIRAAHARLRKGGRLWVVANRHLPYESVLAELFSEIAVKAEADGFKVIRARK